MTTRASLHVAVLPGDGIGPEVTRSAMRVLQETAVQHSIDLSSTEHLIGACALRAGEEPLPESTRTAVRAADAVLLGAVGDPEFDREEGARRPEAGLLGLRRALGVWVNLRPAAFLEACADASPLKEEVARGADLVVVRELLGGIYFGEPRGRSGTGDSREAFDTMRYSAPEIERVARHAFELARARRGHVTSVDKANVLESSRLWREVVDEVARDFPDVTLEHVLVDACAMRLVTAPTAFDVMLASNHFGDVLSDEAAVLFGSLGMLPSASLGDGIGLFEPVHGSAPALAGQGRANPAAAILSAALLLRHAAGLESAASAIEDAVRGALDDGARTDDLVPGSSSGVSTDEFTDAVLVRLRAESRRPKATSPTLPS